MVGFYVFGVRYLIGFVLLTSAADKANSSLDIRRTLDRVGLPPGAMDWSVRGLVAAEFVVAVLLLLGLYWGFAAAAAVVLFAGFTAILLPRIGLLARDEEAHGEHSVEEAHSEHRVGEAEGKPGAEPCGCGGVMGLTSNVRYHVAGNALFILLAGSLALLALVGNPPPLAQVGLFGNEPAALNWAGAAVAITITVSFALVWLYQLIRANKGLILAVARGNLAEAQPPDAGRRLEPTQFDQRRAS